MKKCSDPKKKVHEISHWLEAALCNKVVQAVDLVIMFKNSFGKLGQGKNLSHIPDNAINFSRTEGCNRARCLWS